MTCPQAPFSPLFSFSPPPLPVSPAAYLYGDAWRGELASSSLLGNALVGRFDLLLFPSPLGPEFVLDKSPSGSFPASRSCRDPNVLP